MKERADIILVKRRLVETRQKAKALIMAGKVYSGNSRVEKAGQFINQDEPLTIQQTMPYVGRGGLKLEAAIKTFSLPISGRVAADLGCSTGGFTDCLLKHGVEKVYAVDVDTRQMDWNLRQDPRIVLLKKNARYIRPEDFAGDVDLVTLDLSFISILKVLPAVRTVVNQGDVLGLIKPQFEVGRNQVGKKGVVKDPALHRSVLEKIISSSAGQGFATRNLMMSSVRGQKGNREFFILWSPGGDFLDKRGIDILIGEAVQDE